VEEEARLPDGRGKGHPVRRGKGVRRRVEPHPRVVVDCAAHPLRREGGGGRRQEQKSRHGSPHVRLLKGGCAAVIPQHTRPVLLGLRPSGRPLCQPFGRMGSLRSARFFGGSAPGPRPTFSLLVQRKGGGKEKTPRGSRNALRSLGGRMNSLRSRSLGQHAPDFPSLPPSRELRGDQNKTLPSSLPPSWFSGKPPHPARRADKVNSVACGRIEPPHPGPPPRGGRGRVSVHREKKRPRRRREPAGHARSLNPPTFPGPERIAAL
jgi:hypothetical protein